MVVEVASSARKTRFKGFRGLGWLLGGWHSGISSQERALIVAEGARRHRREHALY